MDDPCFWCDGTGTIACARQYLGQDGEVTCETWFEGICGACGGSGRRATPDARLRGERLGGHPAGPRPVPQVSRDGTGHH